MLKLTAGLAVILLGTAVGCLLSRRYQERVRQLEQCDVFLARLSACLGWERLTTRELFCRLAESESLAELSFVRRTAEGLREDVNFPSVWQKALSDSRRELALTGEDYRPLLSLTELIGAYDVSAQQDGIEAARLLLREQMGEAQEQYRQNGRLSRSMGMLSGIACAILLL